MCPGLTHSFFLPAATYGNEQFFNSIPNIEWNENSRMSEVNELPQMCFPHGALTSTTIMTGIYPLKKCAGSSEQRITSKDRCRLQTSNLERPGVLPYSAAACGKLMWGEMKLKREGISKHFHTLFPIFSSLLSLCLFVSLIRLRLFSVSLTLSAPEARAWWQL